MTRLASIFAVVAALLMSLVPLFAGTAAAAEPGNQYFSRTWQRTDLPVADQIVSRTWMWGPEASTDPMVEPYAESPGGERTVQYFDKSRMEITHPGGDSNSVWYVTNGLLVVELITGQMQIGDNLFEDRLPAEAPVAGDQNDPNGPTYATFGGLLDAPAKPVGDIYTERLSRTGEVTDDPALAGRNIAAAHVDEVTRHTIAAPFWEFMNSSGTVYENGQFINDLMFQSPLFATGRPISEAYWAEVLIAGTPTDVLMQCFERRCLTYNPSNPEGWQVEAGNVGLHYHEWRYGTDEDPAVEDPSAPDPGPGDLPPGDPPPSDPPPADPPADEPPVGDVPPAPENLSAEVLVDDGVPYIALSWHDRADNEDGFRIYSVGEGNTWLVAEVEADAEFYADHDFANLNPRGGCYYVEAFNAYGSSGPSNESCATVSEDHLARPMLVSPEGGYVSYHREITFKWDTVAGSTGYVICLYDQGGPYPYCDFDATDEIPYAVWISGAPAAAGEVTHEIPADVAPEGVESTFHWTVSACPEDAYDCIPAEQQRLLTIDLRQDIAPPVLDRAEADPNDPGRFTFYWDLSEHAERYIICVAEPGANCEHETGNFYKSSILGPAVDAYPLDIPLWLAPDGQVTNLNWTVAACDADLNCYWQYNFQSIVVDRAPENALTAPNLVSPTDGYLTSDSPVYLTWDLVPGAASYRVCLAYEPGDYCYENPTFMSSYLDATTTTWAVYTPEGIVNELEWTVAACDASNDCVWQEQVRSLTVNRALPAPELVSAVVDQNDPGRFVFSWNLVQGAERYIVCVAEPGANCENETGNYYKSSILGPAVDSYPLDIPVWLAPDGQLTNLHWTVAACDIELNCVWQYTVQQITVDRT